MTSQPPPHGQQPWGPSGPAGPPPTQQWGQPQPPAPKKKHTVRNVILAAVGVLVLIGVIGAIAGGGKQPTSTAARPTASKPTTSKPTTSKPAAEPAAPGVGAKARDGKFQFVVRSVKSTRTVGSGMLSKKAQGQFIIVAITVKNIGDRAQTLDGSSQTLYDAKGRKYSSDTGDAAHDSAFSGGVDVAL